MRPAGGGASGGSLRSSRQAAAPAGRASPRVDCCISIVLTAGRGHASFLEMLIINEL